MYTYTYTYIYIHFFNLSVLNYRVESVNCVLCGHVMHISACDLSFFAISSCMPTHKSDDPLRFTACSVLNLDDSKMKALQLCCMSHNR